MRLLERAEDVDALDDLPAGPGDAPQVALLAQTTLSHDEWAGIVERARERFPDLWMPNRSDLCFATTNRQAALKALAGQVDAVVVIGSENSSNTVALEQVAVAFGCPRVVRVNDASELPDDLSGTVGVTAGASAPEAAGRRGGRAARAASTGSSGHRSPSRRSTSRRRPSCASCCAASRRRCACSTASPARVIPGSTPARGHLVTPAPGCWPTTATTAAADVLERLAG